MKKIETHKISPYIHASFIEYFGSTIYDGIWVGKDSKIPNVNGIRKDVIDGCREAGISMMRWPGGCCAEKYHWMDGVGKERYPREWFIRERDQSKLWDNSFGTDEFLEFCRLCDMEPMIVANVSSGTAEEFQNWVEYCNAPKETKYGRMRAENGHPEPYNIKFWGIGNTDENTWKMANHWEPYSMSYLKYCASIDYHRLDEMKIVGLGLSIRHGIKNWVEPSLDYITDNGKLKGPDYLSIHHYLGARADRGCGPAVDYTDEQYYYFLDALRKYQQDIDEHRRIIAEHTNPKFKTKLAFDEWGTWHAEATIENDQRQPQTMSDAIFAALSLHIFYRNSDIVELAMETQLTNLLQSLFETDGERFYKTPTFYTMKLFREHKGNYLLDCDIRIDGGKTEAVASISEDGQSVVVTLVNSDLHEPSKVTLPAELADMKLVMSDIIAPKNVRAENSYTEENIYSEKFDCCGGEFVLPEHSILRLKFQK